MRTACIVSKNPIFLILSIPSIEATNFQVHLFTFSLVKQYNKCKRHVKHVFSLWTFAELNQ